MSDYSSTYPTQSPVFAFDAKAGKLDSRISYSRSSTGTYMSSERHLSSENLLPYSNDLSQSVWTKSRVTVASTNNAAPDGTTTASSLLETTDTDTHTFYDNFNVTSGQQYSYVFYFKANGRTKVSISPQATATIATVQFDLTAVTSTVTSGSADSHSITAIGATGWYKCAVTVTATATGTGHLQVNLRDASGNSSYTGDVTKGVFAWGASVSSTGQTVLNETSGQIHREFAPTLKTAAADAPRFEYAADGQSEGLLVESQVSNIFPYSRSGVNGSGAMQFNAGDASIEKQVAVGPDGTLSALKLIADSSLDTHYCYLDAASTPAGSSAYTISCYAKADGEDTLIIRSTTSYSAFATAFNGTFTLTGAGTATATGGTATAKITAVGNGWYRCSVTETTDSSPTGMRAFFYTRQTSAGYNGNDFDGILMACFQVEKNSAPSSWIDTATAGASASRAADSCSVATADIGYTGGPVSVISEFAGVSGYYPEAWELRDTVSKAAGVNDYILPIKYSASADASTDWRTWISESDNLTQTTLTASSGATKLGVSVDTNSVASCADGGTIYDISSTVIPDSLDTLYIGRGYSGYELGSTIKRLSLFNVALSDTELQALTSNP